MSDSNFISEETQEQFERFLLNRMDTVERSGFLKTLNNDPVLKERFMEFQDMFRAIEESVLRESLGTFHSQMETKEEGSIGVGSRFFKYRLVAGIALLLSLGAWFLFQKSPSERRYQEYFLADPGLPTVMGTSKNYAFYEAMVDYKQGKYKTAIDKWEKIRSHKMSNDTLNYFIGSAYLADGNPQKAIGFMQKALETENSAFKEDIYFYLGLAHLKMKNEQKALEFLTKCNRDICRELASKIE